MRTWRNPVLAAALCVLAGGCAAAHGAAPHVADPPELWAAQAVAVVADEIAAGARGVDEAVRYAAPDVLFDDRSWSGELIRSQHELREHLAATYGPTLDELRLEGVHVEAGGALLQLHLARVPGLRGPADVLQRRLYTAEGVAYVRNDVALTALRDRPGGVGSDAFAGWEALAADYLAAWADADGSRLAGLYAPDARVVDTVAGLDLAGRADIARHAGALGRAGPATLTLARIPGGDDPALYLDTRLPQLAGTLGVVFHASDAQGCRATVAAQLLVAGGLITGERRFHDPEGVRRCERRDPPDGWWSALSPPAPAQAVTLELGGRTVEVRGSSHVLDGLLVWAVGRFDAAGLAPPPLTAVTFERASGRCTGVAGRARRGAHGTELTLCLDDEAACRGEACASYSRYARITVLHELAHAWEHALLDERTRQAYLDRSGIASWNDPQAPWAERGVERVAETLMWGLMDEPVRLPRIGDPACPELDADYRLLTGRPPPRPPCA